MRNLKKILALVLALVMSMSLLATANASFADKDKIDPTYAEAVEVLNGLGVFKGRTDGNFDPKAGITRAEVAAIIYRIVTGDVEDKQVKLYSDYKKFSDVNSASWYAGYVNFCANGEYIKGYPDGKFGPNDDVTGYQALAMILRAVGYDKNGEFTGKEWTTQTAAVAKSLGITNNIIPGTLGTAASRETVAEILFRAILVPTVEYTLAYGYRPTETTLGWKAFELEEINGVVVANEFADLNDDETLAEGKTQIQTADKTYTLAITTTLDDIGEARYAYIAKGGKVLAIADAGNTVWETNAATKGISDKDADMKLAKAEEYVNFANGTSYKASDMKIKYVIKLAGEDIDEAHREQYTALIQNCADCNKPVIEHKNGGKLEYGTYTKTISIGKEITALDLDLIYDIFDAADLKDGYKLGEVYVGTQSKKDISDEISFKEFKKEYITEANDGVNAKVNENGNYIKVIDNDGDGYADYILKTEYVMAAITDISKKGNFTVSVLDDTKKSLTIDAEEMVTEDELAEGDVIVYALIDGLYNANLAEKVTETIDRKGIDYKKETITCGENTYEQSGIAIDKDEFQDAFLYDTFLFDVTDAQTEVAYDLYLDNFGYVRAYTLNKHTYGLGLLTDAYYYTNYKQDEAKVDLVYGSEKETEHLVSTSDSTDWKIFIDYDEDGDNGNRGTWERLIGFKGNFAGAHQFDTNVAAFSAGEETTALYEVDTYTNKSMDVKKAELLLNGKTALSTQKLTARVNDKNLDDTVYATTDTVYYYVTESKGDLEVQSWVGYKNAPKGLSLKAGEDFAYAVYTETKVGSGYYYADVIVIEAESSLSDANFIYYANTKNHNAASYWLKTIEYDAENEAWDHEAVIDTAKGVTSIPMFYEINDKSEIVNPITSNYAHWNIFASTAVVDKDIHGRNYVYMADDVSFLLDKTPVYALDFNTKLSNTWVAYSIDSECGVSQGDDLIYVTDGKDVQYVINVTESWYKNADGNKVFFLRELWRDISGEHIPTTLESAIADANAITSVSPMGQTPAAGMTAWTVAVKAYQNLENLINTLSMTQAERDAAVAAQDGLADKLVAAAKLDALTKINAEYSSLVPNYTNNMGALNAAKLTAETTVNAWEIDDVIPEYDVPTINVAGIETDAVALPKAKAAAEARIDAAYTAALELSQKYDTKLAPSILLAKESADKALKNAGTVAECEAINGDAISAIVVDCVKVDVAMEKLQAVTTGHGWASKEAATADLQAVAGDDVTITDYTATSKGNSKFVLSVKVTAGTAEGTCTWNYTVVQ